MKNCFKKILNTTTVVHITNNPKDKDINIPDIYELLPMLKKEVQTLSNKIKKQKVIIFI